LDQADGTFSIRNPDGAVPPWMFTEPILTGIADADVPILLDPNHCGSAIAFFSVE